MKRLRITIEGKTYEVEVEVLGEERSEPRSSPQRAASTRAAAPPPAAPAAPKPASGQPSPGGAGEVPSPLSGSIVSIDAQVGQEVAAGHKLITMEAMKMHTIVNAPTSGKVVAVHVQPGQAVEEGQILVTLG